MLGEAVFEFAVAPLRSRLSTLLGGESAEQGSLQEPALKQVTVLFVDLVGSTDLSRRLDPEDLSAVVDDALKRCSMIVRQYGGKVLQYAGDSVLGAFGTDITNEDDPERAVRCGLALLAEGQALAFEVRKKHSHENFGVRVGVHTGEVLLGGTSGAATIWGLTVNVAARMQQTAPAGALRISNATYRHIRGAFDVESQPPLQVKGVDEPMATYLVTRAKPRAFRMPTRGVEGIETRMVGREAESGLLRDAFDRVLRLGAGFSSVFIVAEAGLGKSRLLHEFQNWADTRAELYDLLEGRATPQTLSQPYGLIRDVLARRVRIQDDDSVEVARKKLEDFIIPLATGDERADEAEAQAHLLGQMIGIDFSTSKHVTGIKEDARQIRNRGFRAAALAFKRMSVRSAGPILLVLEDLHWADESSLDFLDYLVRNYRDVPMLVLASTRNTLLERRARLPDSEGSRIDLKPLSEAQSRELADQLLKRLANIPPSLLTLLVSGAHGNPFYMEELVKMLIDSAAIRTDQHEWRVDPDKVTQTAVPGTLTGVLQARLDLLPRVEREALQIASVVGLTFWDKTVAFIKPGADAQLPSLAERELIDPVDVVEARQTPAGAGEYAFRHQILHQVTYESILKSQRRVVHAKAAQWFASATGARGNDFLGAVAEHYEKAGDAHNACDYFTRAAEHAAATLANDTSLEYVERGLRLASDTDGRMRWRLLASRERTLDLQGRRVEQRADIDSLGELAESLDDDDLRGEVAFRLADIAMRTGDNVGSEREARHALAIAERQGSVELALRAEMKLAIALANQGRPVEGQAIASRGWARARNLNLKRLEIQFTNCLGMCSELTGNTGQQLVYLLQNLRAVREIGDRRMEAVLVSNSGLIFLKLGDDAQADRYLEEGLRLARVIGIRETEGHALCTMSELALRRGKALQARAYAQSALEIAIEVGARYNELFALAALGNGDLALRRWEAAASDFERMEALAREVAYPAAVLDALEGLTRLALEQGAVLEARDALNRLMEYAHARDESAGGRGGLLAGSMEHWIRLTRYKVLARSGDANAQEAILDAYTALQSEASAITDESWRRSFLENIPEHREIVALWQASSQQRVGTQ